MSGGFWRLFAALSVALCATLALAWCVSACGGHPPFNATDKAEYKCIEEVEGGAGKAALKAAIDDCRFKARSEGGT